MNRKPALLFYCQHSLGMGHLVRSFALARQLGRDFHVVFLNGGLLPVGQRAPEDIEIVNLPPLGIGNLESCSPLVSRGEIDNVEVAKQERRRLILQSFHHFEPAVIAIELFPFGRKKFADEILPLLEAAHAKAAMRPVIVCSLRDILVGNRRDQQRHDDRASELVNRYFDAVLVHSDAAFSCIEESFHPNQPLAVPVCYTGFISTASKAHKAVERERRVLVSAGGGIVGAPLFRAALAAHEILWAQQRLPMTIVTGPFLPENEWSELQQLSAGLSGLTLKRSLPELGPLMRSVSLSVSQCGYNTAMDILASGVAASVVPFAEQREDEQLKRAQRLEKLGLMRLLTSDRLDGDSLALEIQALEVFQPNPAGLDLNGAEKTAQWINQLLREWAETTPKEIRYVHLA